MGTTKNKILGAGQKATINVSVPAAKPIPEAVAERGNAIAEQQQAAAAGIQPDAPNVQPEEKTNVNVPGQLKDAAPSQVNVAPLPKPKEVQDTTLMDIVRAVSHVPTPQEVQAQKKREERDRLFSAIGDSIGAAANMAGTMHGAQSAYDPNVTASKKIDDYYNRLNKETEEKTRYATKLRMEALQADRSDKIAKQRMQAYLDELERQRAENDRNFEYKTKRDAVEDKYKDKQLEMQDKQFGQQKYQFDEQNKRAWANYNLDNAKFADAQEKQNINIDLAGQKVKVNSQTLMGNIPQLFAMMPEEERGKVGKAISDGFGGVSSRQNPTAEEMYNAVIGYINNDTAEAKKIRESIASYAGNNMDLGLK